MNSRAGTRAIASPTTPSGTSSGFLNRTQPFPMSSFLPAFVPFLDPSRSSPIAPPSRALPGGWEAMANLLKRFPIPERVSLHPTSFVRQGPALPRPEVPARPASDPRDEEGADRPGVEEAAPSLPDGLLPSPHQIVRTRW